MVDVYSTMAVRIIEQQEDIIGPIAIEQADQIDELSIDWQNRKVTINGNGVKVIDKLVNQYRKLFGPVAVEASKEAASKLLAQLPQSKKPKSLT